MRVTFFPPGEQVSGGGVLVMFRGLEPQLDGEEPRILMQKNKTTASNVTHSLFITLVLDFVSVAMTISRYQTYERRQTV